MKKHLLTAAATASILFASFAGSASAHENIYSVQSGDTVWKISQANHISVADLKAWNNLSSDTIYLNQKLSLLAPHSHDTQPIAPVSSGNATYTVKSGDTLSAIAKTYGTTVTNLKTINHLTADIIYIGQNLVIKSSNPVAPAPTPVAPVPAPAAPAPTVSKAQKIMDEAKKYMGVPYLWGGSTPAGFDCSGFVQYAYSKAGLSIPRTTSTQWTGMKYIITATPGDLVFFNTNGIGVSHVGIYLGNNKFIHAGSSGITISDMSTTYWKPKYLGARASY